MRKNEKSQSVEFLEVLLRNLLDRALISHVNVQIRKLHVYSKWQKLNFLVAVQNKGAHVFVFQISNHKVVSIDGRSGVHPAALVKHEILIFLAGHFFRLQFIVAALTSDELRCFRDGYTVVLYIKPLIAAIVPLQTNQLKIVKFFESFSI